MIRDRRDVAAGDRFTRRAALLFGVQFSAATALGWRLYDLQVVDGAEYQAKAEENRLAARALAPERGAIFDRFGQPLAANRPNYAALLVREQAQSVEEVVTRLRQIIDLSRRDLDRLERRLSRTPGFVPVPVKDNLDWDSFARLNANAPVLPGVLLDAGWARMYPDGATVGHVVGYVGAVTENDLENDAERDPILRLPGARIGKSGVERSFEKPLRGSAGSRRIEVNAAGREIREIERRDGTPGQQLTLTLDIGLQTYAMERLKGESGAAVVLDTETGDILALASAPSFDPNKFVFGISHPDWDALRNDQFDPLRDKAAAGVYPPGSTWKMMTALAALEAGFKPRERVRCTGSLRYGNRTFHCWKRQGHGSMRLRSGIKNSCDLYFYEAAQKAGIDRIADMARRFGVGERPDIMLPNVKSGLMPTPDWMRAEEGRPWSGGDTLNVGIGQGALLMTPLQMAVMTARLANGRVRVAPRLIMAVDGVEQPIAAPEPLGVDPEHIELIREAMGAVVNEPGGTAYRSRTVDDTMSFAGKTGTAQVRSIGSAERSSGVRDNEELPWRLRDHALFVAFGPVSSARYAIAVVIEHGGGGSRAAAPVARDILLRAMHGSEAPLASYPADVRPEIETWRNERASEQDAALDRSFWSPGDEHGFG